MVRKILKWTSIIISALIVIILVYGSIQYSKAKGTNHFISERIVEAPKAKVWRIISDVGNYHKVTADGIDDVKIIEGEGLGLKRICADQNGNSWEETCTSWIPEKEFGFEVNTQKEDYPLPFKSLSAIWKIDAISPNKTKITIDMSYEFKNAFLGGLFLNLGEKQAKKDSNFLLDNWQKMAENNQ
ncbi:SRPBCC family protein [uncultured Psychroserpens sp.]|uniref:type II toxin-antitoxin system RatA family toxin n=1 Tax=uncultured Psychroserpens sp. TaxID=255436 RepID=UPI00261822A6|nr:SRPBCC family protein [uncultured Psychroserpens sp.]